jgi:oligoendopeptidase F
VRSKRDFEEVKASPAWIDNNSPRGGSGFTKILRIFKKKSADPPAYRRLRGGFHDSWSGLPCCGKFLAIRPPLPFIRARNFMHAIFPSAALLCCGLFSSLVANAATELKDYSLTERSQVPEEFKFNLADLFKDTATWRAEFDAVVKLSADLDGLAKDWTRSPARMADALDLIYALNERGDRLYAYAKLQNDMDLSDSESTRLLGEIQAFTVSLNVKCAFLAPGLLAMGDEKVTAWLASEPRLAPYRFPLERVLRKRAHTLTEQEETIVAQMGLWADTPVKVSNLLKDVDLPRPEVTLGNGTKVVLNDANFLKHRVSRVAADRRTVVETYWKNVLQYENTFAALLDGEMRKQVANSRIRKFPTCLEANLFENNISPDVYRNLISTVRSNLGPLHRLFRLKQRMLGLSELNYYDIAVPSAPSVLRTYTFEEAKNHVLAATAPLGDEYGKHIREAFAGRWVDIYPNKGKQVGAYSLGVYGMHPFVKMNYNGRFEEVSTLAHELGHSMHSVFSNATQPLPTAEYSIFIAEIASTFNEILLVKEVLRSTDDDRLKLRILEGFLERMRGTLYAQTLLAEFELAMHEQVEKGQSLTADWLKATYAGLFRHYHGVNQGIVKFDETLAVSWAAIPHFYRPFYVFQYSTGIVASTALADAVLNEGPAARDRYLSLLRSGSSKFPLDLLRDAGVDMSKPEPIHAAIKQFDSLVAEMETIYDRLPQKDRKGTSE